MCDVPCHSALLGDCFKPPKAVNHRAPPPDLNMSTLRLHVREGTCFPVNSGNARDQTEKQKNKNNNKNDHDDDDDDDDEDEDEDEEDDESKSKTKNENNNKNKNRMKNDHGRDNDKRTKKKKKKENEKNKHKIEDNDHVDDAAAGGGDTDDRKVLSLASIACLWLAGFTCLHYTTTFTSSFPGMRNR